jgi:hypothetical protein
VATLTYIGPPSPGWADPDHNDPDDPQARWLDDLGVRVELPNGTRLVTKGDSFEVPDDWADPDHPDGRVWPDTLWRVSGGPTDGRKVGDIRAALERRGLPTDGKRDELLARLTAAEQADPGGGKPMPLRNLGSPDNPGDFDDAPGADTAREELIEQTPPPAAQEEGDTDGDR